MNHTQHTYSIWNQRCSYGSSRSEPNQMKQQHEHHQQSSRRPNLLFPQQAQAEQPNDKIEHAWKDGHGVKKVKGTVCAFHNIDSRASSCRGRCTTHCQRQSGRQPKHNQGKRSAQHQRTRSAPLPKHQRQHEQRENVFQLLTF